MRLSILGCVATGAILALGLAGCKPTESKHTASLQVPNAPAIVSCDKDLSIAWAPKAGAKIRYEARINTAVAPLYHITTVTKIENGQTFVGDEAYLKGRLMERTPDNNLSYFLGFMPANEAMRKDGYRRSTYNVDLASIWNTLKPSEKLDFDQTEASRLGGSDRSVTGKGYVKFLGCSTIPVQGKPEFTRVYELATIYRSRRADDDDTQGTDTTTYYVSPKFGIYLASSANGYTNLAQEISSIN